MEVKHLKWYWRDGDMNDVTRITLEGFEDFRGDFDTGIYLVKPIVDCVDGSTIENVIEDFCIEVSLDNMPEGDAYLDSKAVRDCFYKVRKKKVTPNFRYFRVVVEVYRREDDMPEVYRIIEREGF